MITGMKNSLANITLALPILLATGGIAAAADSTVKSTSALVEQGVNVKIYNHGVAWEAEYGVTQAYAVNGTIYIAGQFSHNMKGDFVGVGDIKAQARQTLENIDRILAGYGVSKDNLAEVEVFLTNPQRDFEPFIAIYKEYMGDHRAAGTLVGVSALAFPDELIEIRAIAHMNK